MATLSLTQHFTVTVHGVAHTGGSTSVARSITVTGTSIHDTTKLVDATAEKILDIADFDGSSFAFVWIESEATSGTVDIQLTMDAGDGDDFVVLTMNAGDVLALSDGGGKDGGAIDTFDGNVAELGEIWAKASLADHPVRVVACT